MLPSAVTCALALALAACSSGSKEGSHDDPAGNAAAPAGATPAAANDAAAPHNEHVAAPTYTASPLSKDIISLEGLGDLLIGRPVPKGSKWATRGAQTSDARRTVTNPDYPGVYAIVSDGKATRVTVGQRSNVKLVEGVGVGSLEKDVERTFGGFRSELHKYEEAPAKYLTAPNAASGDPALRFEIGKDRKVSMIHVGIMPVLAYVEGCG
ncbi:hypothetical protein [Sphingobium yanoikuyae]|uniref:Uncharacterized protein n=1 Tax=Sphingobium yanoikuyae TaxID=13690 RepID=A0A291N0B2_SPHYA|nr:hypothetical protein [Sphingobium yanoikuyae]ATI80598.1 hypothetical protein A6768_11730 [Sphingobium yanoikuyae]